MTTTIDISLYPLNNDYPSSVLAFLEKLKSIPGIELQTNGMSTHLIGPFSELWPALGSLMEAEMLHEDCVFVLKTAPGRTEYVGQ